ncbi:MAG: DsbA family protein [Chitinophagaceae bacterium]|nr:MAG: DsbA family protein [Chitinophagaceae bacterium]
MNFPKLVYCYDAYCGWCYGFSPVIKNVVHEYSREMLTEVLSGGMILPEKPVHIRVSANYISKAYKHVEETTGIKFGQDYLWHILNPEDSDWFPNSEKPAIALCIFKEYFPDRAVDIAADIQYALHFEGRDLTDDEAYRHLLEKYDIQAEAFYQKLSSEEYKERAYEEFDFVKQLQVDGYPTVFVQTGELKYHMVARGFTPHEVLKERIDSVLAKLNS